MRSEVERRLDAGRSVVLEIEVQGAQQVRAAQPDSVQIFIAPPDPEALRERLRSRGTDSPEAIDSRLETAEHELAVQGDFDHRIVNADLGRAATELEEIVRAELGLPQTQRPMIRPRVYKLLEHADSHYAAVVVSAKRARQIKQPLPQPRRGQLRRVPLPWSRPATRRNYLSARFEELAEGKLKDEYRA